MRDFSDYDVQNHGEGKFSTQKLIWTQVFREHFPRLARRITAHRMAEYDASILGCVTDPGNLPAYLTTTHVLDVHRAVCNIFATSENLFFITDVQRGDMQWTVVIPATVCGTTWVIDVWLKHLWRDCRRNSRLL
jgi:hypothetical protein